MICAARIEQSLEFCAGLIQINALELLAS